jgi:large subunit ribosomal protein L18
MANRNRAEVRSAVHNRIRRKVRGTNERPRLAVYRSLNHIYAQVIDDDSGRTLASASTTEKDLAGKSGGNIEAAKRVGQSIAERALAAGVESVVFDRGGYLYHGRVRALTDAARAAGLNKNEVAQAEAKAAAAKAAEPAEAEPAKPAGKEKAPKEKKKKEAAPKESGAGEAGAEPKAKKESATKDADASEANAEPKAKKQAAPKEDKEAGEGDAGTPPENSDLKETTDGGEDAG